jgi:hypothetical protein
VVLTWLFGPVREVRLPGKRWCSWHEFIKNDEPLGPGIPPTEG